MVNCTYSHRSMQLCILACNILCIDSKGVNPCSNMGGIILLRNIHPACGMDCEAPRFARGPGNIRQEYFNHICGSLLNFKKSYSSHLNISRSIVPQMFIKILIKNFNKSSINFQ